MKKKDALRVSTIRMLISSVGYASKEKQGELTDDDVLQVLAKEAKKRKESADAAKTANRTDVAEKELKELAIIEEYLPAQMTAEEVEAHVKTAIEETGASSPKDKGKVMGKLMKALKGKADGNLISQTVDRLLAG